jgi:cytochrome d ubiquinol oxidase subunit I
MDVVLLSRIQFALTIGFHFIFPPLTIGLSWLIFWIMTKYKKTREEIYRKMARFWIKIFTLSFAIGVATGIVMEFQFGTNWSEYSRFVGDIFGAPLAAEGIFAFFLESSFLALLVLGWNRLSVRIHWFSSLMVAFGSTLSALWIIIANSWQQTPAGFEVVGGRAVLTNFWAAAFNPSAIPRYLHTVDAALISGAFFMMGLSAWFFLKGRHMEFAKRSLKLSLIVAFITSVLELGLGHYHAVQVANTQPEKLAAYEGLFETQTQAPMILFGIPDAEAETVHAAIRVPGFLSFLTDFDFDAEVQGLKDFPKDEWPPLGLTFFPFHLMFIIGMYFILITLIGMFLLWKNKLYENKLFLKIIFWSIPLPIIACELGWIAAEVGRQPWIVYHLLKTRDAVSISVPAWQVLFSIIIFVLIYILLFFVWIYLLKRQLHQGPEEGASAQGKEVAA